MEKISSRKFHTHLGDFKKIREMLGFDGKFLAIGEIAKVRRFWVKTCKRSALNDPHKIRHFQKIPEMLWFDGEFPAIHPIAKSCHFLVKNCRKSALTNSTRN